MLSRVREAEYGQTLDYDAGNLTSGDIAIIRFLAAVELIESDFWQQYDELGGATNSSGNTYRIALQALNGRSSQCITSNAQNEVNHATFLNGYLESRSVVRMPPSPRRAPRLI